MRIGIEHGSGGIETWNLLEKLVLSKLPPHLRKVLDGFGTDVLDDGAYLGSSTKIVLTMDSYTVNPLRFPGGSLGTLAACGTINDLVVMGARPLAAMDSIVVAEGMEIDEVDTIVKDMIDVFARYGIALIGGDLKVMPRNSLDSMIITVAGIGVAKHVVRDSVREGDKIIVTGPIAEHGAVILAAQLGMLDQVKDLRSDVKPLIDTLLPVIEEYGSYVHAARDPTRGGLAVTLNEWVRGTDLTIVIDRSAIPIREEVKNFLDALGIDPLTVACEGVAVLAVDPRVAEEIVEELRKRGERMATIVGEVKKFSNPVAHGKVVAITEVGGRTIVEPRALNLPRIC